MPTYFSDIYDLFLSKIIDYDFLTLSDKDREILMNVRLKSALAKFKAKDKNIIPNYTLQEFNRELTDLEQEAISYWLVFEWITPKINNVEMFEHRLNTKEFQGYSEANHLKEMQEIRKDAREEAFYWTQQLLDISPSNLMNNNLNGDN